MTSMDTIEQIKNHIAKGETDKAIALLVDYTKKTNSSKQDDAILLSGQYRQWKREISLGVEQSSSELRRIEMTIMDILQEKKSNATAAASMEKQIRTSAKLNTPTTTSPNEKNKMIPILLGILGMMILGFGYMFLKPDSHAHDTVQAELSPPIETSKEEVNNINEDGNMVTGRDLHMVSYGNEEDSPIGFFKQERSGTWKETGSDGEEARFTFKEVERNEFSVYLLDESRDVEIHLDLSNLKILFIENEAEEQFLGKILTWGN